MPLSRRTFLKKGTLSAFAAGCVLGPGLRAFGQETITASPAADFPIPYAATQSPAFYYTRQTFEPYIGDAFRGLNNGSVWLQLLSVKGYTPAAGTIIATGAGRATDSFSLTFRSGRSLTTLTSTHRLEHAALGKFDLFMTRTIDSRGRIFYEAVINHVL